MRPLDPLRGLRFTRDRAALHAGLEAFSGRKGDLTARSTFEEVHRPRAGSNRGCAHADCHRRPARADTQTGRPAGRPRRRRPHQRGAAGSGGATDRQDPGRAGPRTRVEPFPPVRLCLQPWLACPDQPADAPKAPAAGTLEWLAQQTGGRSVPAGGDLASGMALMSQDLKAYYAITYRPTPADGKFHPVEIRTTRRNAAVRARPGYWAPLGGEWRALLAAGTIAPISTRPQHRSAFVETWIGIASDSSGRARMVISWEPRGNSAARHRPWSFRRGRLAARSCSAEGLPQPRAGRPVRPTVPGSTFRPDESSSTSLSSTSGQGARYGTARLRRA